MKLLKGLLFLGVLVALTGCEKPVEELGRNLGCIAKGTDCGARGRDGAAGAAGMDGQQGIPGLPGSPGSAGSSCSVQTIAAGGAAPNGGARISCTDGTDAIILNGSDAPTTPYTIVNVIKPCPTVSGPHPEMLLVLANRTLLASVSQSAGANTRLALVTPGNYVTSDGRSCAFTVTAGTVSWGGGNATY